LICTLVAARSARVAVDAVGIRPVGFDRHGAEAPLLNEPLGDLSPLAVELVRAVRGFAQQHQAGAADLRQ
jgi:hypothetical protein